MNAVIRVAQVRIRCSEHVGQRHETDEIVVLDDRQVMNPVGIHCRAGLGQSRRGL